MEQVNKNKVFFLACIALILTSMTFAIRAAILTQLAVDFLKYLIVFRQRLWRNTQPRLWAVFVAEQGVARKRSVQPGSRNQRLAWIEQGLKPGEQVIVYPPDALTEGSRNRTR